MLRASNNTFQPVLYPVAECVRRLSYSSGQTPAVFGPLWRKIFTSSSHCEVLKSRSLKSCFFGKMDGGVASEPRNLADRGTKGSFIRSAAPPSITLGLDP